VAVASLLVGQGFSDIGLCILVQHLAALPQLAAALAFGNACDDAGDDVRGWW